MLNNLIGRLEKRLKSPLPGSIAQNLMSPIGNHRKYVNPSDNATKAGVLALMYPKDSTWHICYIKRTSQNNDKHSGQISFPGGRYEESDGNMENCAIRETHEEIGISPDSINIISNLTSIFVHVSNYMVYPYLAYTSKKPNFILQHEEVADVLSLPIEKLLHSDLKSKGDIQVRNQKLSNVPYYKLGNDRLWGATAMMTSEIEAILKDVC